MDTIVKSLSTLQIYQRLKKVKTFDAQAKELAGVFQDLMDEQLAAKEDVRSIEAKLEETKAGLSAAVEQSRNQLQIQIEKSKTEILKWIIGWVTGLIVAQTSILFAFIRIAR